MSCTCSQGQLPEFLLGPQLDHYIAEEAMTFLDNECAAEESRVVHVQFAIETARGRVLHPRTSLRQAGTAMSLGTGPYSYSTAVILAARIRPIRGQNRVTHLHAD